MKHDQFVEMMFQELLKADTELTEAQESLRLRQLEYKYGVRRILLLREHLAELGIELEPWEPEVLEPIKRRWRR